METFKDKTRDDPNAPIAFEPHRRAEAAPVLGITQEAGAERSFRALRRIEERPATMPGGWEGP